MRYGEIWNHKNNDTIVKILKIHKNKNGEKIEYWRKISRAIKLLRIEEMGDGFFLKKDSDTVKSKKLVNELINSDDDSIIEFKEIKSKLVLDLPRKIFLLIFEKKN